jgi:trimeric autotransporter adhesin
VNDSVLAIAIIGSSDLYVGGNLTAVCGNTACNSGNTTMNHIAKHSGGSYTGLGQGMNLTARAITTSGSDVFAGGDFYIAGTCTSANGCNGIAEFLVLGYHLFLPLVIR